jgi:2-oxoglutarate dehydrogenase E1 component
MKRSFRKPLVIMTPKSLLRAPECVSQEADFTSGHFEEILSGPLAVAADKVSRVIFCSGKVYYDLLKHRESGGYSDAAIIRVEQLYPLHDEKLQNAAKKFRRAKQFVWCQEEPENMGAFSYIQPRLTKLLGKPLHYAGRDAASSPAVGALSLHKIEQHALLEAAFTIG